MKLGSAPIDDGWQEPQFVVDPDGSRRELVTRWFFGERFNLTLEEVAHESGQS